MEVAVATTSGQSFRLMIYVIFSRYGSLSHSITEPHVLPLAEGPTLVRLPDEPPLAMQRRPNRPRNDSSLRGLP